MAAAGQDDRGFLASDTDHPTIGAALVSSLPLPREVSRAIATHHEWFDGWGFPEGASGHDIPVHGRVLAIAEFVAEMAAPDPIRAAWPVDRIAAELRRRSGSQFDPDLVEVAVPLLPQAVGATTALLKE
jgi:HD-GYP domain-containing protein (c-di-GMP phosphodiesterase class II)